MAALSVSGISPADGWPGTVISVYGTGFSEDLDDNTVDIGGVRALIMEAAATRLRVLVDEHTLTGPVRVSAAGHNATAPEPFTVRPWPELRDVRRSGAPAFFHGPQTGTPAVEKLAQPVLVIFAQGKNEPPVNIAMEVANEMASFHEAERFWREASYAAGAPAPHGTTLRFLPGPWVSLPGPRNDYVWDDGDIAWARGELLSKTKRWVHVVGNRLYCAHQGGGLAVADVAAPNGPAEIGHLGASWVAQH